MCPPLCIIQSSFTALNILCAPPIHPIHPSNSWQLLFTVSIILSFPECHNVGIIKYVAFSNGLLSLRNKPLSFLHVFWGLPDSLFLFISEQYSIVWMYYIYFTTATKQQLKNSIIDSIGYLGLISRGLVLAFPPPLDPWNTESVEELKH